MIIAKKKRYLLHEKTKEDLGILNFHYTRTEKKRDLNFIGLLHWLLFRIQIIILKLIILMETKAITVLKIWNGVHANIISIMR